MNVANALAAAAAAWAAGAHLHDIRQGLRTFTTSFFQAPGRLNYLEVGGVRVVIDYCHNVDGMRNLADFARRMNGEGDGPNGHNGRALGVIGMPGDRRDEDMREYGALRGRRVRRDHHSRGPQPARSSARRGRGLRCRGRARAREAGTGKTVRVDKILDELSAVKNALRRANPGDLVVMCVDDSIARLPGGDGQRRQARGPDGVRGSGRARGARGLAGPANAGRMADRDTSLPHPVGMTTAIAPPWPRPGRRARRLRRRLPRPPPPRRPAARTSPTRLRATTTRDGRDSSGRVGPSGHRRRLLDRRERTRPGHLGGQGQRQRRDRRGRARGPVRRGPSRRRAPHGRAGALPLPPPSSTTTASAEGHAPRRQPRDLDHLHAQPGRRCSTTSAAIRTGTGARIASRTPRATGRHRPQPELRLQLGLLRRLIGQARLGDVPRLGAVLAPPESRAIARLRRTAG